MNLSIQDKITYINRVHQEPIDLLSRPMNMEQMIEITRPPRILRLTLKKYWFDLMKTGVKNLEFRKESHWIKTRLVGPKGSSRRYDYVEFVNGYRKNAPRFIAEYWGYFQSESNHFVKFNDSERIEVKEGDYVIKLGRVISIKE